MTKTIVLLAAICACCSAAPAKSAEGDFYGIATLHSLHQNREAKYNEKNYGIGLEYHVSKDFRLILGEYKNSFENKSEYFGIGYFPFHRGDFSAGIVAIGLNGYDFEALKKFGFVAAPVVSYEKEKLLLNFVFVPPIHNDGVIAAQVGFKFNE